jgi:hypothetical protein
MVAPVPVSSQIDATTRSPQVNGDQGIPRIPTSVSSATSKSHLKGPTAPMALTPAIAVSLGLPSSNIPSDMKVEVVHLYVVRIPLESPEGQQGNKIFAYDVVTSGGVPPAAEAVASYANQCLLWRSGDDSVLTSGASECPERNSALLKWVYCMLATPFTDHRVLCSLKSRVWQDFVHSTSASKTTPSSGHLSAPPVAAVTGANVAAQGARPQPSVAPLPSPRMVHPAVPSGNSMVEF